MYLLSIMVLSNYYYYYYSHLAGWIPYFSFLLCVKLDINSLSVVMSKLSVLFRSVPFQSVVQII